MATAPHGIPTCATLEEAYRLGLRGRIPMEHDYQLTQDSAQVTCDYCIAKLASEVEQAHLPQGPKNCSKCNGTGLSDSKHLPNWRGKYCGACNGTGRDIG